MKRKMLVFFTVMAVFAIMITAAMTPGSRATADKKELPVVGSAEKLQSLLEQAGNHQNHILRGSAGVDMAMEAEDGAQQKSAAPGHSTTNTQVEGVDEADVIKTDGKYIYQVSGQKLFITRAYPAGNMEVVSRLDFKEDFRPAGLYVDSKHLVMTGSTRYDHYPRQKIREEASAVIMPPPVQDITTRAVVFNIEDKDNIKRAREVEIKGRYISSRKIDGNVYLVANQGMGRYHIMEEDREAANIPRPAYRDSNTGTEFKPISLDETRYLPGCVKPNYITVCGFNLNDENREAQVYSYLGDGENIYASPQNLYVAAVEYEHSSSPLLRMPGKNNTVVFRFALDSGNVKYTGKGEVPGRILNQFSMDEHEGYFRIATTTGHAWRSDGYTSKNNLYVLDSSMTVQGKIEDIAPGERIYSTRFMGDRAYMVTFKKVDPLFVIDLKNPENPEILGKLKIPGYSDYLHPYGENYLIGFGKDTEAAKNRDIAYYQGMKLALFDVSDVNHPEQKFTEIIGDRGTQSELLRNHRALLFSGEKNLLAFPVTVMENKSRQDSLTRYGQFTFQGAYVYRLSPEEGFELRGKITHLAEEDYRKSGHGWYDSGRNVQRVIYIGNNLYTLSREMIKVHDLQTMQEKNSLSLAK